MSFEEMIKTAKEAIIAKDGQLEERKIQMLWTGSAMNVVKVCCYASGNLYIVTIDTLASSVVCEKFVKVD